MKKDEPDLPIPNAIVVTEPHAHRSAAQKLRECADPAMAQLAQAHESLARAVQERIDREAPPLAPE
jgi:hypothetical protein